MIPPSSPRSAELPASETDLCYLPAVEQWRLLADRRLSARELLDAYLARIERINPHINAIVTMHPEEAREQAQAADDALARGEAPGPLHGLVIAHKDLMATKGMRTTWGSRLFEHFVPAEDAEPAVKMRQAGAIRLGKTNVPEMGAGSHTFNPIFGATRNPYDRTKTAGGSSGGAGAALASGLLSLADGSDMGGSLRNPASFNNVVGLRPAPGRVSRVPVLNGWSNLSVVGGMGRTVADCALLTGVLAGFDPRDPVSLPGDGSEFIAIAHEEPAASLKGLRVGWSRDLGGLPIDPAVTQVLEADGRPVLESLGAAVRDLEPDLDGAEESFRTLRAWEMAQTYGDYYRKDPALLSENVRNNVSWGLDLTATDIHRALLARTRLHARVAALFEGIDILATPAVQLPPFPVDWTWPREVAGVPQPDYLGWMRASWHISATVLPAISVPCGFTEDGLPVGIQFVGRALAEAEVLRVSMAFEAAHPAWRRRPSFPEVAAQGM